MKKNYLAIILLSLAVIFLADNVRLRIAKHKLSSDVKYKDYLLAQKEESFKSVTGDCKDQLIKLGQKIKNISPRYESSLYKIKAMGLADPLNDLRDDLMKNQDLIPHRNMPKGEMHFMRDQISVINARWVLAYYENGHFDGELIARFTVDKDGHITWKVIDENQ